MSTETTTELLSPDTAILKTELYDVDFARQLIDDKTISKEMRDKLRLYCKSANYKNHRDVPYKLGRYTKHEHMGRYCAVGGLSLQTLSRDIRNAISGEFYWDLDIVNAQPTLLKQYADRNGWKTEVLTQYINARDEYLSLICENMNVERWEAKEKVIAICFGCGRGAVEGMPEFFTEQFYAEIRGIMKNNWELNKKSMKWIEKMPNYVGKALAHILQTEERKCLMAIDDALAKHRRSLDVLIHDGGLVRKKENETAFPTVLLTEIEKAVEVATGYKVQLLIKPMKTTFVKKTTETDRIPSNVIIDDAYAAKVFADLCGENIVLDGKDVWIYNDGLWSADKEHVRRVVTLCADKLVFRQEDDRVFNYSGVVKNTGNLIVKLPDILPRQDGYFKTRIHTDIGKLLFPNGIYDFKTGTFSTQFDPAIVFTNRMPRPFPVRNQSIIDEIRRTSFTEAFATEEMRDVLLHSLMRAFIGDVLRKKFNIGTGWGNSGKGMLATLLHCCMGMLCSDFNGNCLLYKNSNGESARDYGWMMANVRSRIAIGSEVRMKNEDKPPCIDGVLIKTISSGVDEIKMRGMYLSEVGFVNKATFFMFAQDIPNITPAEKTVMDRLIAFEWSYSYVDEPVAMYEKKKDTELALRYALPEYGDAFFWLMVEEYEKWRTNGFAEPAMSEVVAQGREEFVATIDYRGILEENGFTLGRPGEFVPFAALCPLFQCSKTMLGRNLAALGLVKTIKKDLATKKAMTVYYGIQSS